MQHNTLGTQPQGADSQAPMAVHGAGMATLADEIEARAWMDYYDAAPADIRHALGVSHSQIFGTTLLMAPGADTPLFNRTIGLGNVIPACAEIAEQIARAYRDAGVRNWWMHLNPQVKPEGFAASLEGSGWHPAARCSWAKMLRCAGEVEAGATTLRVEAACDETVGAITDAIRSGFEMPAFFAAWLHALHLRAGWTLFGVFDGESAVGGGALFMDGRHAWLGIGSVVESHRRRGAQRALMAKRVQHATANGAHWIATETGESTEGVNPSLLNMHRCGFQRVASRLNLVAPASLLRPT